MRILSIDLIDITLPLVSPFTTSFSTQTSRSPLLVKVTAEHNGREVTGWGECVVLDGPVYSPEYLDGAREVLQRFLIPALYAWQEAGKTLTAELVGHVLEHIVGHRMAKAALEMAILDAQLRATDISFASYFGATVDTVPSGVSVGIQKSIPDLLSAVGGYLDQGYVRIKLKIQHGWDIEPVRAVRERFGDIPLQVDANTAYRLVDAPHLRKLDPFNLLLIEQPLAEDDLRQHALLAREISTPMCLDESIVSAASAADAIAMGAAAIINIKPGRVGGYLEAKRIHDIAVAHGVAVWCGGMLETGLGRAANAALAGLPGFTLPGDISASDRFYKQDITEPFRIEDGQIRIPGGPGIGVEPIPAMLAEATTATVTVAPRRAQTLTASARRG
ncbi:o-succinylbenzoate synthase [Paenarthrobacter sp. NPDC056912]|uniref:o-succinylbenzoate synthase n=1 Tax=Paenarthrobacter sp. NPDC056912 TaxID=3345965 RepID=UPI0036703BDC